MPKQVKRPGMFEIEWRTVSIRTLTLLFFGISALILSTVWYFWLRNTKVQFNAPLILEESAARFIDYEGKVEVKPKDEYVWKEASFKMDLHEGDRIRTAPDSSAKIKFDDGTEITIQTDSIVVISKKMATDDRDQAPLAVVENGESDINAEKSSSPPSVSTARIPRFKLSPGSTGSVRADQVTGEHVTVVEKGIGIVTDTTGRTTQLNTLEQLTIEKDDTATKVKLPFTPPLLSPPQGQLFEFLNEQEMRIELKWRDVSNAVRYHIQISESPLFAKITAENPNLTKSSIAIKIPKTHKKQYFWRVRSVDGDHNHSPWSDPFQFVVYTPTVTAKPTDSLDKTPPALKITYMHPFLPYVQVEGMTEADAFLTLNGQIIDVKEDGSFVYTYTLQQSGWNDLNFIAEDPSGNKTAITKKVEYK
jgi:Glucodextranase, domain B/FecR protein